MIERVSLPEMKEYYLEWAEELTENLDGDEG
jgi:hypothetical protein